MCLYRIALFNLSVLRRINNFQTIDAEMQAVGCGLDVLDDLTDVDCSPGIHRFRQASMMNKERIKFVVSLIALANWRLYRG